MKRIGEQSYKLALPPHLHVHDVFHVNLLKSYAPNLEHILELDDTLLANLEEFITTLERILDTVSGFLYTTATFLLKSATGYF